MDERAKLPPPEAEPIKETDVTQLRAEELAASEAAKRNLLISASTRYSGFRRREERNGRR
jgi:hypothetical protein